MKLRMEHIAAIGDPLARLHAWVDNYQSEKCIEHAVRQLVIAREAPALALTTLACRRAGLDRPTLVRDERGAALDPENGRAYVAMLRRAVQLIGADRCLLVSHVPELQELCDARINIADGKVEVRA